jgi:hypothetical protein
MPEIQLPYVGTVPILVLVIPLLYGPLLIWGLLRLAGFIFGDRERKRPGSSRRSDLLFWACDECHSVTPEPNDVCYYCGTRRVRRPDAGEAASPNPQGIPISGRLDPSSFAGFEEAPPGPLESPAAALQPAEQRAARPGRAKATGTRTGPTASTGRRSTGGTERSRPAAAGPAKAAGKAARPTAPGTRARRKGPVLRVITPSADAARAISEADSLLGQRETAERPVTSAGQRSSKRPEPEPVEDAEVGSRGGRRGRRAAG